MIVQLLQRPAIGRDVHTEFFIDEATEGRGERTFLRHFLQYNVTGV